VDNSIKQQNIKTLARTLNYKKYSIAVILFLDKVNLLPIFSTFINIILRLLKIKKRLNPRLNYYYYAKIFKNAFKSSEIGKENILFPFIMGSESTYNLREMMIAKFLETKGYSSHFLYCDGVFGICSKERIFKTRDKTPFFCRECFKNYNFVAKKTGLDIEYLSNIQISAESTALNNSIKEVEQILNIDECQSYVFQGIPIGSLAYKSVLRFFQKGDLNNTKYELDIYKSFIQSTIKTYYLLDQYFSNHSIHTVVLWNGTLFFDATIIYICQKRGIPFITQESFIGSNSWIYKRNDVAIYLNFFNEWKQKYANQSLTYEQKDKVLTLFHQFKTGESTIVHFNDSKKGLVLDDKYEYVALFPSLNFDSYVLGRNPVFSSSNNWIIETINYWNREVEGIRLIIRAHPGEIKLLTATTHFLSEIVKPLLTDKIIFIDSSDDVSSYEILKRVKYTLCYSSTVGVEAMLSGIPTVIAGESFYKPFAIAPKTKDEYFSTINDLNRSIKDISIDKEQLLNYLHYLYFIRTKQIKGFDIDRKAGEMKITKTTNHQKLISDNQDILEEFYQEINKTNIPSD